MSGLEHFRAAEKILSNIGGEQDAAWSTAWATRALAHATLAAAARDYGLHTEIAVPPVSVPAEPAVKPGIVPDELTFAREHRAELHRRLLAEGLVTGGD